MMNIDRLLKSGKTPRLHGNGFVQLDMSESRRLHVWPYPALAAQVVNTQIHNHTFCFESEVILGRTSNIVYDVFHVSESDEPSHVIYEATPRGTCPKCQSTCLVPVEGNSTFDCPMCAHRFRSEDTLLQPITGGEFATVKMKYSQVLEAGDCYTFPAFEYHEHAPYRNTVATIMEKTLKIPAVVLPCGAGSMTLPVRPRVLCRRAELPDNDFNRHNVNVGDLWQVIAEVCREVNANG